MGNCASVLSYGLGVVLSASIGISLTLATLALQNIKPGYSTSRRATERLPLRRRLAEPFPQPPHSMAKILLSAAEVCRASCAVTVLPRWWGEQRFL